MEEIIWFWPSRWNRRNQRDLPTFSLILFVNAYETSLRGKVRISFASLSKCHSTNCVAIISQEFDHLHLRTDEASHEDFPFDKMI